MGLLLDVARAAAAVNVGILLVLGYVWVGNYRDHGASHTLALLVFAAFLLVENLLWLYFYVVAPDFVAWFVNASTEIQAGLALLCGLELVALAFLGRITVL
jgi:hypothetical protein